MLKRHLSFAMHCALQASMEAMVRMPELSGRERLECNRLVWAH